MMVTKVLLIDEKNEIQDFAKFVERTIAHRDGFSSDRQTNVYDRLSKVFIALLTASGLSEHEQDALFARIYEMDGQA